MFHLYISTTMLVYATVPIPTMIRIDTTTVSRRKRKKNEEITTYNCNTFLFCMGYIHKKGGQNNRDQWGNCRHPEELLVPFSLLPRICENQIPIHNLQQGK